MSAPSPGRKQGGCAWSVAQTMVLAQKADQVGIAVYPLWTMVFLFPFYFVRYTEIMGNKR